MALTEQQKATRNKYYHEVEKHNPEYIQRRREKWAKYRALNGEKLRTLNNIRVKADRLSDPLKYILRGCKRRAQLKNIEFTISISDIEIVDTCPVLGIPIFFYREQMQDNSVSIDRVDNSLGYIPGNVRLISYRANRLKNDATLEEIELVASYIRRYSPKYNTSLEG